MATGVCEECRRPTVEVGDVVTGLELLAALAERAAEDNLQLDAEGAEGECLVYMVNCAACSWQSLRSTARIKLLEDPEPIA
jgi:hypothetical protein